jgi:hypothetical protein
MAAWRKVTETDLTSALSAAEVGAFKQSAGRGQPVAQQIAETVQFVRGCIRSGGRCRMDADGGTLPEGLIAPAMDFCRYRFLTRIDMPVNEARTKLYEDARKLFDAVAEGAYVPEGAEPDDAGEGAALSPASAPPRPPRLLD